MSFSHRARVATLIAASLALTACSSAGSDGSATSASSVPSTTSQPTVEPSDSASPQVSEGTVIDGAPTATVQSQSDLVSGLAAPWEVEVMADRSMLISERDTGAIKRVRAGFATSLNGPGAEALRQTLVADGEGGLLGLAISPTDPTLLYAYLSRADGNAVVRMSLTGELLSSPVDVVSGIPHATNHDGGRIAFGPDGYLYIATGDAAEPDLAQDDASLAGKILRVVADGGEDDGSAAPGNPDDSLMWSKGHRNVQGIAWAADGRMYASEFGQSELDELNLIEPGANYGWPSVEGLNGSPDGTELGDTVDGLTYPVVQWEVADASPSGISIAQDAIYVGALRGEGVWRIPLTQTGIGSPARLDIDLGRVRDVEVAADGSLLVLTNNTDGRGEPREGDDHVMRLELS